jgi:hypothetical protein
MRRACIVKPPRKDHIVIMFYFQSCMNEHATKTNQNKNKQKRGLFLYPLEPFSPSCIPNAMKLSQVRTHPCFVFCAVNMAKFPTSK